MKIYPSLISADLLHLASVIQALEPHCDGFHLDVMDNHFVPNLTWGPAFINAIASASTKPAHIHLMVTDPASILDRCILPQGSTIAFHPQTVANPLEFIKKINNKGLKASVAVSPEVGVESIRELLPLAGQVLVMSVNPGFSGQQFMPEMLEKVRMLATYKKEHALAYFIAMDGGINKENIALVKGAGADAVAIATGIFGQKDLIATLQKLQQG